MRKIFIILFLPITCFSQPDSLCIKCKSIEFHSTAVGYNSVAKTSTKYDPGAVGGGQIAIGLNAQALAWRACALGDLTIAGSVSSTAIGYGAVSIITHGVAVGRGAWLPLKPQNFYGISATAVPAVIGCNTTDFGIGNWWGHKFKQMPSGTFVGNKIPSQITLMYHGQDAYDDTTSEVNIAGGHIGIAAGRGTGSGIGGEVRFYTAPKGVSGSTKNLFVLTEKITVNGHIPYKRTDSQMQTMTGVEEGTEIYNTTLHKPCWYNGTMWQCADSYVPMVRN